VFVSHLPEDGVAVEALARELRARGVDVSTHPGTLAADDDPLVKIDDGLARADAGLVVFSSHARRSLVGSAEAGSLMFARIEQGKALIPVEIGADAHVPPPLRPFVRRGVEDVDAIADALLHRRR
jgi:hypothetical protein